MTWRASWPHFLNSMYNTKAFFPNFYFEFVKALRQVQQESSNFPVLQYQLWGWPGFPYRWQRSAIGWCVVVIPLWILMKNGYNRWTEQGEFGNECVQVTGHQAEPWVLTGNEHHRRCCVWVDRKFSFFNTSLDDSKPPLLPITFS